MNLHKRGVNGKNMTPEYGSTYYQITYADVDLTMPGIQPMVYVGLNIFDDENEDTYYFQDTVSVIRFGLLEEAEETSEIRVMSCLKKHFGSEVVTIDQLPKVIADALTKNKELNNPVLKKAKGKWVSAD